MTILRALALNVVMLCATVGFLYWALQAVNPGPESTLATSQASNGQSLESALGEPEQGAMPEPLAAGSRASEPRAVTPAADPGKVESSASTTPVPRAVTFPIDINMAPPEDLEVLPGIGEKLAQRIIEYRKRHGGFRRIEDLREVKGIGKKRMERLRPLIMTGASHD